MLTGIDRFRCSQTLPHEGDARKLLDKSYYYKYYKYECQYPAERPQLYMKHIGTDKRFQN